MDRSRSHRAARYTSVPVWGMTAGLLVVTLSAANPRVSQPSDRIPAFARKYRTSCTTCHTAAPKLNVLGEAFRLNGYRFPDNDALLRRDRPVPLGSDEWKDIWPRGIWPGELPGTPPIALRIQNDVGLTRDATDDARLDFRLPHEVYLLAGTTLGEQISVFLESEWSREGGVELLQAKVEVQDVLPWLPARTLNLWVGVQNLYLFTFADRQIDRAARQNFRWQDYRVSDLELEDPISGATLQSINEFQLRQSQPSIELNGMVSGRLAYAVGVAQGTNATTADNNRRKDFYYKVRYKLGGLGLDGRYRGDTGPLLGGGGQLLDRSLTLEHFGYLGAQPAAGDRQDDHRAFGVAARALWGPVDLGFGHVWGQHDRPWGADADGDLGSSSFFVKGEYLFFPWLLGSFKVDTFSAEIPASIRADGFTVGGFDQTRIMPGAIFLIRQNVRGVLEAELFTEDQHSATLGGRRPRAVWLRLDMAF